MPMTDSNLMCQLRNSLRSSLEAVWVEVKYKEVLLNRREISHRSTALQRTMSNAAYRPPKFQWEELRERSDTRPRATNLSKSSNNGRLSHSMNLTPLSIQISSKELNGETHQLKMTITLLLKGVMSNNNTNIIGLRLPKLTMKEESHLEAIAPKSRAQSTVNKSLLQETPMRMMTGR